MGKVVRVRVCPSHYATEETRRWRRIQEGGSEEGRAVSLGYARWRRHSPRLLSSPHLRMLSHISHGLSPLHPSGDLPCITLALWAWFYLS